MVLSRIASRSLSRLRSGYTLVEVLVASGILMMGISAACLMSLSMVTQEEMNYRIARCLNLQEAAARTYQLGLAPTDISGTSGILPGNPDITLAWTAASANLAGVGTVSGQTVTATIYATPPGSNAPSNSSFWTAGAPVSGGARTSRTNAITIYRAANP
jgi:type II secretory pathway pseudopilin PulG